MSDDTGTNGTGGGTGNPGGGTGGGSGDERAAWTPEQWQSEIDRRVNDAVKSRDAKLKDILAAKDQEAETKLSALQQTIADAEARAAFAEGAISAGVKDIKGGFAIATSLGYVKDGKVDFEAMKANHPALFGEVKPTPTQGGGGTQKPTGTPTFSEAIRAAAGYK